MNLKYSMLLLNVLAVTVCNPLIIEVRGNCQVANR